MVTNTYKKSLFVMVEQIHINQPWLILKGPGQFIKPLPYQLSLTE
jgi:hypothetical protein